MAYHKKAEAIQEAKLGKDHLETAVTYNNIGVVYSDKGELDRALALGSVLVVANGDFGREVLGVGRRLPGSSSGGRHT